ncbi:MULTISPECIES: 50S ribosomal protein L17 [unclassified Candidatus Lariskella]|uniref:50S ribosomal protein L17 n=1 Tax=unclassified Candidatus Lariskella TaxID=2632605 RepID=UPI0030D4F318
MYHGRRQRKFSRYSAHRKSMLMNLSRSLIEHEQIMTTLPKAKDMRPVVEKIITLAKKNNLHARRRAMAFFGNSGAPIVAKLFSELASRYKDRNGGYTRILKAGFRQGDCAPVAYISLLP